MPLNRFITFVKPYLNLLAGAIAAFLIAKANVLGIPGLGQHGDELTIAIAGALAWLLTQGATQLGDLRWLKGHQLSIVGDAQVQAALLAAPGAGAGVPYAAGPDPLVATGEVLPFDDEEFASEGLYDEPESEQALFAAMQGELPDDDEEFAAPPPDATNMPTQPSQVELNGVPA